MLKDVPAWIAQAFRDLVGLCWLRKTPESQEQAEAASKDVNRLLGMLALAIASASVLLSNAAGIASTTVEVGGYKVPTPVPAYAIGLLLGLFYVVLFNWLVFLPFPALRRPFWLFFRVWVVAGAFWLVAFGLGIWVIATGADLLERFQVVGLVVVGHGIAISSFSMLFVVRNAVVAHDLLAPPARASGSFLTLVAVATFVTAASLMLKGDASTTPAPPALTPPGGAGKGP